MQKYLIPISVTFMALSLGSFMVRESTGSVISFGTSSILFGFLCFLERRQLNDTDEMKAQIKQLNDQLSNIMVSLGWNR